MKSSTLVKIFDQLDIDTNEWVELNGISRITLVSEEIIYPKNTIDYVMQYYFDTTHELVEERYLSPDRTKVIANRRVLAFEEIEGIFLLNPYSESQVVSA